MAIRFSCDCGAQFEVADDKAGLLGRCTNCGQEMTIPFALPPVEDHPADPRGFAPETFDADPVSSEEDTPPADTSGIQYCPFCGQSVQEHTDFCPNCRQELRRPPSKTSDHDVFTTIDWTLATVLAPIGLVLGFVSLVTGNPKGLKMMAVSTAGIFVFWLIAIVMGWIG
ncbi:MAG: hypothetical protein RDU20_18535 [Desulfomonilaceae bacterium]|nr:hypothetical protein [Desulfomonilaceae bacterium]